MKSIPYDDIAFCPLDIPVTNQQRQDFYSEVSRLSGFFCEYRNCEMIPLYTPAGLKNKKEIKTSKETFDWTQASNFCPSLVQFIKSHFFPFMEPKPRIVLLKSKAQGEVMIHTDCDKSDGHLRQHKLRLAISGDVEGLWFLTANGERRHITGRHPIYILSGAAPHGAINRSPDPKITLCLGSPWSGQENPAYWNLLERSLRKFSSHIILKSELAKAEDFSLYQKDFEKNPHLDQRPSGLTLPERYNY